jgi:hypothetical protein
VDLGIRGQKHASQTHPRSELYAKGFEPSVERLALTEGVYELSSPEGRAILAEPYATIFSHLMGRSEEDIEQMLQADV